MRNLLIYHSQLTYTKMLLENHEKVKYFIPELIANYQFSDLLEIPIVYTTFCVSKQPIVFIFIQHLYFCLFSIDR
jgi:hypothetical protein